MTSTMIDNAEPASPAGNLLSEIASGEPQNDACTYEPLPSPRVLRAESPVTLFGRHVVREGRDTIRRILARRDRRFLVVVGPCSIHDPEAALAYAERLAALQETMANRLFIVMRTYFEKPRTTVGWRGLINDPHLDGSFDMAEGLRQARRLLAKITAMGLPVATEMLDTTTPAYFGDLISLAAIGARTVESQPHRALASGLGMPVGFKNGTDGTLQTALDALVSASQPHSYLGVDADGKCSAIRTSGNRDSFLILRGGKATGPNHLSETTTDAGHRMNRLELEIPPSLLIDCSHANSGSDPSKQPEICLSIAERRRNGEESLTGVMLESNIHSGKQSLGSGDRAALRYGVSVTDACLGWEETEELLRNLGKVLQ